MDNLTSSNSSASSEGASEENIVKYLTISSIILLMIIAIVAIVGNGLVLAVQFQKTAKTSTDFLLATLACVDFIMGLLLAPIMALGLMNAWFDQNARDILCRSESYLIYVSGTASTTLLSSIALDRYFKVCSPHVRKITPMRAKYFSITVIVVCAILCAPATLNVQHMTYRCLYHGYMWNVMRLIWGIIMVLLGILFVATAVLYFLVARRLRSRIKTGPIALSEIAGPNNITKIPKNQCTSDADEKLDNQRKEQGTSHGKPVNIEDNSTNKRKMKIKLQWNSNPDASVQQSSSVRRSSVARAQTSRQWVRARRSALALFTMSLLCSLSWSMSIVGWSLPIYDVTYLNLLRKMLTEFHMINCAANPVLFIWLSSRAEIRQELQGIFRRN